MVRLLTRIPSLSNSPRIRSAPRSRFSWASCLMSAIVSGAICSLWRLLVVFRHQSIRNNSRCQRRRVSGGTLCRACCQKLVNLASEMRRVRSEFFRRGLFACRLRMISCCRSMAFYTNRSVRLRVRSDRVAVASSPVEGLDQRLMILFIERRKKSEKKSKPGIIVCSHLRILRYGPIINYSVAI